MLPLTYSTQPTALQYITFCTQLCLAALLKDLTEASELNHML